MDEKAERLIEALTDPTISTAEALSELGTDAGLLRVRKPSDPAPDWTVRAPQPGEGGK